jgi:hypothetical protein
MQSVFCEENPVLQSNIKHFKTGYLNNDTHFIKCQNISLLVCKYAFLPATDDESFNKVATIHIPTGSISYCSKKKIAQYPMPPFRTFQSDSSKISQMLR